MPSKGKKIAWVSGGIVIAQLVGCSVAPTDPRSPYYASSLGKAQANQEIKSAKYIAKKEAPASYLSGSVESRLWQHFQQWKGTPYAYGGSSRNGIDCSAYVRVTLDKVANIQLPRTTETQIELGKDVELSQLKAGDVVFFQTGTNQLHNGVYMGGGKFMHASSSMGVMVSEMENAYWQPRYVKSIRLI